MSQGKDKGARRVGKSTGLGRVQTLSILNLIRSPSFTFYEIAGLEYLVS